MVTRERRESRSETKGAVFGEREDRPLPPDGGEGGEQDR